MARGILIGVSFLTHCALAVGLGGIRVDKARVATAIEIADAPPPPAEPPKAEIAEPPPAPDRAPPRQARPSAQPPPEVPQPEAQAFSDLPDFGLSLGGAADVGGIAVPQGKAQPAQPLEKVVKELGRPVPAQHIECAEPTTKPKPLSVPQPSYTEQARAAGIEGRVRVQLTVDETGQVINVEVLQGLGHGLDEAALAAARSARFEPAMQCGRPKRATFTISMRFSAS